jgi:hypothetical protein
MALPVVSLPTATVDIDGQSVSVRGLTRGEAMIGAAMNTGSNAVELEKHVLVHGLDTAAEEIEAWYDKAPSRVVQTLVEKIMELSGMDGLGNASGGA